MRTLTNTICNVLQHRYLGIMAALMPQPAQPNSLFAAMFEHPQDNTVVIGNKVDQYLNMGIVITSTFIDVMQCWTAYKELLLTHYQMAADYLGSPTTSTLLKCINNTTGCEFTNVR